MARELDFSNARRGAAVPPPKGKTRITIYLDDDVLDAFRARAEAEGRGYQTAINDTLRRAAFVGTSQHEALLARLHEAIAGVLQGVRIGEAPTRARPVAKRAKTARKVGTVAKAPARGPAKR